MQRTIATFIYTIFVSWGVFFSFASAAYSDVVTYKDEAGKSYFVDGMDKVPERYRSSVKSIDAFPKITKVDMPTPKSDPPGPKTAAPKVTVFVTSWCPYCVKLEKFLNSKRIKFTRYDIEKDSKGRKMHSALGGGGVPLTSVGNKVIRGFDPNGIERALQG